MSTEHTQSKGGPPPGAAPVTPDVSQIAAELAALGEPAVDDVERAGLSALHAGPETTTVQTLMGLAEPLSPALARPLSELELARVYRRVAIRLPAAARPMVPASLQAPQPARRSLMTTLAVVAAAAAFVLVPVLQDDGATLDTPQTRQQARSESAAMGASLQAGVKALGPTGSARARALADDYAARMQAVHAGGRR